MGNWNQLLKWVFIKDIEDVNTWMYAQIDNLNLLYPVLVLWSWFTFLFQYCKLFVEIGAIMKKCAWEVRNFQCHMYYSYGRDYCPTFLCEQSLILRDSSISRVSFIPCLSTAHINYVTTYYVASVFSFNVHCELRGCFLWITLNSAFVNFVIKIGNWNRF